jgi:predicted nucleotidyltransferase component of viral defense system
VPGKGYFSGISRATGFKTDSLEKLYRIIMILDRVRTIPILTDKLALKGGTAIHGLVFGFRRLSVDIDLNYVGNVEKDAMQSDREEIRKMLLLLFKDLGYRIEKPVSMYAEEQFNMGFTNCGGGADRLKLEINYLERLPVMGCVRGNIGHLFSRLGSVEVLSYRPEELFAGKIRALLTRGSPRDMFDSDLIARKIHPYDEKTLRKLILFYVAMSTADVRDLRLNSIDKVTEKDMLNILHPMLRKDDVPDLTTMRDNIDNVIGPMLALDSEEKDIFDLFYNTGEMDSGRFFEDIEVPENMSRHPAILWRVMQMERKKRILK